MLGFPSVIPCLHSEQQISRNAYCSFCQHGEFCVDGSFKVQYKCGETQLKISKF
jgi:hypothetical protein